MTVLPVGTSARRRLVHLLLHPSTTVLLSVRADTAVPHLSSHDQPGALPEDGQPRLPWHTSRGQRRVLPRTRIGRPNGDSGRIWHDTTDAIRLSDLLARHLHGPALDENGTSAHQRAAIAAQAEEPQALLRATPWPDGAERLLPMDLPPDLP